MSLLTVLPDRCLAESLPEVSTVEWKRFRLTPLRNKDALQCGEMLLHAARYNLSWTVKAADSIEQRGAKVYGRPAHDIIRPACSASYALSVVLKTGLFDEKAVGVSRAEAVKRTVRLIKITAALHKNCGWKYPWQSAFWAANLAHAAWLLWEELDGETRKDIATLVLYEANRFIGYSVPYWNGEGGDTKAEENAWNATIIHVAVAMMPQHPNVLKWKQAGTELMLSAYAQKSDLWNERIVDGKPVKDWIKGFNVRSDGAVINHNLVHCDYMCCITMQLRGLVTQSIAGQTASEAVDFNASRVYSTLVSEKWPSPPYKKPGGTMYIPGKAGVYYPKGTDWSDQRFDIFYLFDVYAHLLQLDRDLPAKASSWMRVRAKAILAMQKRLPDGRMFAKGEFDRFPAREQLAAWQFADAYLLFWLHEQNLLSAKGNWLSQIGP